MATTIGSPRPFGGLIVPLYTLPNPPSPIFSSLWKPFVASLSSSYWKTLKLCSFSLYNSGMLRGDCNESNDLVPRVTAELSDLFWFCSSGADLDPLLVLNLSLKKKQFIFLSFRYQMPKFKQRSNSTTSQSSPPLGSAQKTDGRINYSTKSGLLHDEKNRESETKSYKIRLKRRENKR